MTKHENAQPQDAGEIGSTIPDQQNCPEQVNKHWSLPRLPKRIGRAFGVGLLLWIVLIMTSSFRALPPGTHVEGRWHEVAAGSVEFLADITYTDASGAIIREQSIFDSLFDLIDQAESFLALDFFLINDFAGDPDSAPRALSSELINALVSAKQNNPDMPIVLVTDPINRVYGGENHPGFEQLEELGVQVVETKLERLRDSNPTYSVVYRTLLSWFGNKPGGGFVPNPFESDDDTTLRSWFRLLNFKANHRKLAVAGRFDGTVTGFVTSANPHDASSGHSNVALRFESEAALDLFESEVQVAGFSGADLSAIADAMREPRKAPPLERSMGSADTESVDPVESGDPTIIDPAPANPGDSSKTGVAEATESSGFAEPGPLKLRVISEAAIRDALFETLRLSNKGDDVRIAMFYMGHRGVVEALLRAAARGVRIRLILDPNRDAFGREKGGIPNRSVANELIRRASKAVAKGNGRAIEVRWYNTSGEQFHTKMTSATLNCCEESESRLLLGSANYTRRNLDDFNLETNIEVRMPKTSKLAREVTAYFERLWTNQDGSFTVDYDAFADESRISAAKYRFMEQTGLSTF